MLSGNFVVVDLGLPTVKYLWKGQELRGVVRMFVYKGTSITLTAVDKTLLPVDELKAYGIKVKELQ